MDQQYSTHNCMHTHTLIKDQDEETEQTTGRDRVQEKKRHIKIILNSVLSESWENSLGTKQ